MNRDNDSIRALWCSRIASLIAVLIYLIIFATAGVANRGSLIMFAVMGAVWGLPLIWFPGYLGKQTGWVRRIGFGWRSYGYVDEPSPPFLVALMGWFFLVGLPVILYLALQRD